MKTIKTTFVGATLLATSIATLTASFNANAVLGPIPIYLNTEYRTDSPVIGSIASTLSFDEVDIKNSGANTFLDFLATVPSVGLYSSQGNVPAIFMRGSNSNHTVFVVDGLKVSNANSQNGAIEYGLRNIALNDIKTVEVIKGANSVLYGSGAIAGLVVITTKKGAKNNKTNIKTSFGTHNTQNYSISTSAGDKDNFMRLNYNKYKTDGINARDGDTTKDKDGTNEYNAQIKFGNENFIATYSQSSNKTEYDRCWNGNATVDDCIGDRKSNKITFNINNKINDIWDFKALFSQVKEHRDDTIDKVLTTGKRFNTTNLTLLNDIKINNSLVNIGLSKIIDDDTTDNISINSKNIFINWQKNIGSIDLNLGTRYINHSKFGSESVYSLSVAKNLNNGIKLTSSYATSFNAPTLRQLYTEVSGQFGGANSNLQPEKSTNIEFGIEKQHHWGKSSIRLYKSNVKDSFTSNAQTNYVYQNIDELKNKGVELSINAKISSFDIGIFHSYNISTTNDNDTQNIRRPKNITNLTIKNNYGKFDSQIQIIKKSYSLDNNIKLPGYTLLNIATNYQYDDNIQLSFKINNATDKDYIIATDFNGGYNQLGRTINIGVSYDF